MEKFDAIIIGGGSAGYAAARTIREVWENVAIVDAAEELGGLCILHGCMPSKTLIYSTEVLHLAQKGSLFGLEIPEAKVDMLGLHARKIRMIDEFKAYRQEQLQSGRFTLIRERARFTGPDTLVVEPSMRELTAKVFIVATGSVVNLPPVPGLDRPDIWTSDDVLELDHLPETAIVLGGGVVACELAQFLNRAGTRVTQIQRSPRILKENSPEAAEVVMQAVRDEGLNLITGTKLLKVEKTAGGFAVTFEDDSGERTEEAPYLVNAMGRRPAIDSLDLPAAGVELRDNGQIQVNSFQQSSNPKIYAAGDVTGPYEIVHCHHAGRNRWTARHWRTGQSGGSGFTHSRRLY
jgi:pyruvate/2-oxoglutarate dehydrogenase complex dihydrolipoamide dehydrogenase (E3) component